MDVKVKVARLSIISNAFLTSGKLAVGLYMGSVSIISEAIHSGLDLIAALIAFFSVYQSGKPADEEHQYGHGKFENLAAIIEAILILIAAFGILYQAIPKLIHGQGKVEALGLGMGIMAVASLVNWFVSSQLMKVAKETDSPALEADAWHLRTDVYTSVGVFLGIALMKITGKTIIDPIIAIGVTLLIFKAAYDLLHASIGSILDTSLPQEEEECIRQILKKYQIKVVEYHELRTRKGGAERYVDLHMVVPSCRTITEVHQICDEIEEEIKKELSHSNVLIHSEPCNPLKDCQNCQAGCTYRVKDKKICKKVFFNNFYK